MASDRPAVGMCFDRTFPPGLVIEFARELEAGGADQLWIIEDCFFTAATSLAGAALAVTERLEVGLGILPAVARNAAVTAMEIATLCDLGPGRVLPGIGHGVQSWMGQMGARTKSPVTTLGEVIDAVTRLLSGERMTVHGRHVHLDGVRLERPPSDPPPVLAGVRGPRSMAMAGAVAGGVVLAEPATPPYVTAALDQAGRPSPFHVATFSACFIDDDRAIAHRAMARWLGRLLDEPNLGLVALPFHDELRRLVDRHGVEGLLTMPRDWWTQIGPIGTMDDALEHLESLAAVGVDSIGLFPPPDVASARAHLPRVVQLAAAMR